MRGDHPVVSAASWIVSPSIAARNLSTVVSMFSAETGSGTFAGPTRAGRHGPQARDAHNLARLSLVRAV